MQGDKKKNNTLSYFVSLSFYLFPINDCISWPMNLCSGTNTAKLDTECLWNLGVVEVDSSSESRKKVSCEGCLSGWSQKNEGAPGTARTLRPPYMLPESDGEQVKQWPGETRLFS